jgi:hypothetical protein
MPTYGSTAAVKDLLSSSGTQDFSEPQEARMTALLPVVSRMIEHTTGAVFGDDTAETVDVDADGGRVLYLPKGIRSVTSVKTEPIWLSGAWTGGTTLSTSDYRLTHQVSNGAYRAIAHMTGGWFGTVLVAGVWEDRVATVPEDITYLANYIAAELFKKQPMSPAGFVGPDGTAVSLRDAFKETEVRTIIERHRVGPGVWVL